jgi:hypothetical protein
MTTPRPLPEHRALGYALSINYTVFAALMRRMGVRNVVLHSLIVQDLLHDHR